MRAFHILCLLSALLAPATLGTQAAFSQDPWLDTPIDPDARAIALDDQDLPPGFVLRSELSQVFALNSSRLYGGLNQLWRRVDPPGQIVVITALADSRADAAEVLRTLIRSTGIWRRMPEYGLGDICLGMEGSFCFVKDRAVFSISVDTSVEDAIHPWVLAKQLAEMAEAKMDAMGMANAAPFELEGEVLKPAVQRSSGEHYEASMTVHTLPDYFPVHVFVEFAGGPRASQKFDSPSDTFRFIWDGYDAFGQPVPDGEYIVDVRVVDGLLREKTISLPVVVTSAPSGPQSLPATRDSVLREREPHRNEGANPRLALMKDTGKPVRPVVGFATEGLQTVGLTRATLVLTIDPDESPTGWGNGRTLSLRRVLEPWTEGNGRDLDLPGNQRTPGTGAGVTWFSPTDTDIGNNSPNGALQWAGADLATAASMAPPVTVTNHLVGEVRFDVTQDLLNGADHGWLILRDQEGVGSKVRFVSREGAAAAGNPELAPRLLLEYGAATGRADSTTRDSTLQTARFHDLELGTRLGRTATAALGEELAGLAARSIPGGEWSVRLLFRLWSGRTGFA